MGGKQGTGSQGNVDLFDWRKFNWITLFSTCWNNFIWHLSRIDDTHSTLTLSHVIAISCLYSIILALPYFIHTQHVCHGPPDYNLITLSSFKFQGKPEDGRPPWEGVCIFMSFDFILFIYLNFETYYFRLFIIWPPNVLHGVALSLK